MRLVSTSTVLATAFVLASCTHAEGPRGGPTSSGSGGSATNGTAWPGPGVEAESALPGGEIDQRFVSDLKQAFAEYKAWGRVDDEMRWAPFLCRMPMPGRPAMSAAEGAGGHAKKLYSLFARDHGAYVSLGDPDTSPPAAGGINVAQIVAKESYLPVVVDDPVPAPDPGAASTPDADHFSPYVKAEDGKTYRASKLVGVYFVIEKPGDVEGTDDGFIYGTVTPSGEVTSAGRVTSCMGCHVQAKYRRFFGSPAQL